MDVKRRCRFRQVQVSKSRLRCEREVLRTDTGSGDRGAVCVWLEPPWWYRRVGWREARHRRRPLG